MKKRKLIFQPREKLFRGLLSMILLIVVMSGVAFAQQKSVSGIVKDETNTPIPGVSVLAKGTTVGTVTDNNGKYSLTGIPANATILSFTFIGMDAQEQPIGTKTTINVVLKTSTVGVEALVSR